MPEASVIIATRNRRSEVSRAIESALAQTVDVEVLVTDDGSDDGTEAEVMTSFPQSASGDRNRRAAPSYTATRWLARPARRS